MKEQIEKALRPLMGMPLWARNRAADMECFHFGARRKVTTRRGELALQGDYGLHIQCAWRIVGPAGIVVGRRDLHYPGGGDPYEGLDEFDYDGPTPSRRDVRLAALFEERKSRPLVVEGCSADDFGGFRLALSDGFALEVFPDDSLESEHWRLFRPGVETSHFVVTGAGIEE